MYDKIRIQNFRGFADLTVAPLRRVNLLVSRSNVGKTAFLEAVSLLVNGQGALQAFPKAFRNSDHPEQGSEFWVWLFHDRRLSSEILVGASGQQVSDQQSVAIQCQTINAQTHPQGFAQVHSFKVENQQHLLWLRTEPEMAVHNAQPRNLSETSDGAKVFATNPMSPVEEARKYHKVMLRKGGEERIQELLRVVEPRTTRQDTSRASRQATVHLCRYRSE